MTRGQRIQHLTFCVELLYPGVHRLRVALPVVLAGGPVVNEIVRSYVHRAAGVVLIAVSLYHLWYVITTPDGRSLIKDMLPTEGRHRRA